MRLDPGHQPFHASRPQPGGLDPIPGGNIPTEVPPSEPDEMPDTGPTGPRTPYPVDDPGIGEPMGPGSEPDYLPGAPTNPGIRL